MTVDNNAVRAWQRNVSKWPYVIGFPKFYTYSFPPWLSIDIDIVFRRLEKQAIYYFYVVVCVLLLAFLDSIREMQKYAQRDESVKVIKSSFAATQWHVRSHSQDKFISARRGDSDTSNAAPDEAFQSSEKLLHRGLHTVPVPGHQETPGSHLLKRHPAGAENMINLQ